MAKKKSKSKSKPKTKPADLFVAERKLPWRMEDTWEPLAPVRPHPKSDTVCHRLGKYVSARGNGGRSSWTDYRVVLYKRSQDAPVLEMNGRE